MAKKQVLYDDLVAMAEEYGIAENALLRAAMKQYELQQKVLDMLRAEIDAGELTTEKSYVAGASNTYAAPLVKELPKHSDAANRTAGTILDIIIKLGHKQEKQVEEFNVD